MFNIESIVRNNIKNLKAYSSARDEFKGDAKVFLDANENSDEPIRNAVNDQFMVWVVVHFPTFHEARSENAV